MILANKMQYVVIELTEARRRLPLHAAYDSEELFPLIRDRRIGCVGVLVNTALAVKIDLYESLTSRVGRLRLKRGGTVLRFGFIRRARFSIRLVRRRG